MNNFILELDFKLHHNLVITSAGRLERVDSRTAGVSLRLVDVWSGLIRSESWPSGTLD